MAACQEILAIPAKKQAEPGVAHLTAAQTRRLLAAPGPHILRHSRAMHLLESGVSLPCIRDLLGHAGLATTQIYARASAELKRKALEAATEIVSGELPDWNDNPELLTWLASL
jgi:site-specific recombinase XerD